MALPTRIVVHELGPREGMQIEKTPIATAEKIRLVDMLSDCVFPEIEVDVLRQPEVGAADGGCRGRRRRVQAAARHQVHLRLPQQPGHGARGGHAEARRRRQPVA